MAVVSAARGCTPFRPTTLQNYYRIKLDNSSTIPEHNEKKKKNKKQNYDVPATAGCIWVRAWVHGIQLIILTESTFSAIFSISSSHRRFPTGPRNSWWDLCYSKNKCITTSTHTLFQLFAFFFGLFWCFFFGWFQLVSNSQRYKQDFTRFKLLYMSTQYATETRLYAFAKFYYRSDVL